MTTTFLHEEEPLAPDQLGADKPPICSWCGTEMWMLSVDKVITDAGIEGTYRSSASYAARFKPFIDMMT